MKPPLLRWTQHTSPSGAMEQQSAYIACSNHYWSEHKALLLHTPTNSATQGEPILLRPSTTSTTHHDTIQISHPPSRKDPPNSRARTLYMYHATGKGKANRARRTSREGHSNKASEHLLTKNKQQTHLQRSPHSPISRGTMRSEAMIYNILSLYLQSIRLLRLPELPATAAGIK